MNDRIETTSDIVYLPIEFRKMKESINDPVAKLYREKSDRLFIKTNS